MHKNNPECRSGISWTLASLSLGVPVSGALDEVGMPAPGGTIYSAQPSMQSGSNLVSNAIKFSPPNSKIVLSAHRFGGYIEISVVDQGRGIPADKQEIIFERFRQVAAEDEVLAGGSGLGLAICKAIVEAHGGKIGVYSHAGAGSTFWFKLPVR